MLYANYSCMTSNVKDDDKYSVTITLHPSWWLKLLHLLHCSATQDAAWSSRFTEAVTELTAGLECSAQVQIPDVYKACPHMPGLQPLSTWT